MTVRSGVRTPWTEWEGPQLFDYPHMLVRVGYIEGDLDLLVEAVRAHGLASSIGEAHRLAEFARFRYGYYGYVDGDHEPTLCSASGETKRGEYVDVIRPCVFALLGIE